MEPDELVLSYVIRKKKEITMLKLLDKHPFLVGFIFGLVVSKTIKKLIKTKITIITLDFADILNGELYEKDTELKTEN